jgi:hypothetical protein
VRSGEFVRDYPQVSIRIPPEARMILIATSRVVSKPQWRVFIEALDCYVGKRSKHERRLIREMSRETSGVD